MGALLSTKVPKKSIGIMRNSIPIDSGEGSGQGFTKKSTLFQKVDR